jgi:CRP-like cAMP-binding protein
MTERQFAPGEVIYREGDKSDFAYFIKAGRVEILKAESDGPRQVTVLGPGDVFGEMGVVLDQRRSVTARALEAVVVRAVSRSGFLDAINQQSEAARPMLKTLLSRLHQEERPSAQLHALPGQDVEAAAAQPAGLASFSRLRLLPGSERLTRIMRRDGLEIARLPFRVGRETVKGETAPTEENDLALADEKPFNLSRRHFSIEQSRRGLIVRDCGSHLGTVVNGVRIGGAGGISIAILQSGDNEIVAGAEGSPYRFTLQVAG